MQKKIVAVALLVSAVMLLLAAAPAASATTHEIVKGARGPKASAQTWTFTAPSDGIWNGHIVNNGLRSLVFDVNDMSSGVPQEVLHQRMHISGVTEIDTKNVVMKSGRDYEVTATPNGPRGSSATVEDVFRAAQGPVASFTVAINGLEVSVDASGSSDDIGIVSYVWNFGDGQGTTGETATHTYAADGTYTITLAVTDTDGLSAETSQDVTVAHVPVPPVASFTATMDWMTVSVDASASTDDLQITSYAWEFGDGGIATGKTATHTYTVEGSYSIVLTVTDVDLLTASATKDVVAEKAPVSPTASFTVTKDYLVVSVDATASSDPDGIIVSYAWDFGDGQVAAGVTATHTYAAAGTYTITLTVTDNEDLTGTAQSSVTVEKLDLPPTAAFTYSVSGLTVSVDASGSTDDNSGLTYAWDFGDGATATGVTAQHTYEAPQASPGALPGRMAVIAAPPPPPYTVIGYVYMPNGVTPVTDASVTITNTRTGATANVVTDSAYGVYTYDLSYITGGYLVGDVLSVTATKGTYTGTNTGIVNAAAYVQIDVVVQNTQPPAPFDVTITLTVTDSIGQTAVVSHTITLTP